ncbi:MAG: hypothetical protein HC926_04335 [Synechococcaceae cyanobacterium SM2_3_60]|nr:hypothetical protein [Synechococcaceae cyanobacterium SM2_3_60]
MSTETEKQTPTPKPTETSTAIEKPRFGTFLGNRPIAANEAQGEDALMGYLD